MERTFNKKLTSSRLEVKIEGHTVSQDMLFKYLGPVIQNDRKIERDVNHRIQGRWTKQRSVLCVIYDRKVLQA